MPAKQLRDKSGSYWIIPEDIEKPEVVCWWQRSGEPQAYKIAGGTRHVKMSVEKLCIRQENPGQPRADVIELSFGQVDDLIQALNKIVEDF